jgi:hypothetical protein
MNGKCSSNEIYGTTLNHFERIWKWVVGGVWRLEMGQSEMMDDIILVFEMTLQLTIGRESFDMKNSSKYTRHSESGKDGDRKERAMYFKAKDIKLYVPHDTEMSLSFTILVLTPPMSPSFII